MLRGVGAVARCATAVLLVAGTLVAEGVGPRPVSARSPDCPPPPVTIQKLIRLIHGPESFDPTGRQVLACYGGKLLTFQAYITDLTSSEGRGGTSNGSIAPRWLDGTNGSWVTFSTGPGGREIGGAVPPALGRCHYPDDFSSCPFRWYWGRWATVTAHFDGPVARTCRYVTGYRGAGQTRADAVAWCRTRLIVLSVGPIKPPPTATEGLVAEIPAGPPAAPLPLAFLALGSLLIAGRFTSRHR